MKVQIAINIPVRWGLGASSTELRGRRKNKVLLQLKVFSALSSMGGVVAKYAFLPPPPTYSRSFPVQKFVACPTSADLFSKKSHLDAVIFVSTIIQILACSSCSALRGISRVLTIDKRRKENTFIDL
jgi:hypothetical protein